MHIHCRRRESCESLALPHITKGFLSLGSIEIFLPISCIGSAYVALPVAVTEL